LDLLLPACCPACGADGGRGLCRSCQEGLPSNPFACPVCAAPRDEWSEHCEQCLGQGLTGLTALSAPYLYAAPMTKLIGDAKAAGRSAAVAALATLCAESVCRNSDSMCADVVIPVPPNPGRRSGPHLATACARALARRLDLPCSRSLRVRRPGAEQHRLALHHRKRAVQGLFHHPRPLTGKRVLLVDDICTSGATLVAASRALRQSGARSVAAVCLCRTAKR
jgi:ComF family protein